MEDDKTTSVSNAEIDEINNAIEVIELCSMPIPKDEELKIKRSISTLQKHGFVVSGGYSLGIDGIRLVLNAISKDYLDNYEGIIEDMKKRGMLKENRRWEWENFNGQLQRVQRDVGWKAFAGLK